MIEAKLKQPHHYQSFSSSQASKAQVRTITADCSFENLTRPVPPAQNKLFTV